MAGAGTAAGIFLMGAASIGSLRGQLNTERASRKPGWHLAGAVVLARARDDRGAARCSPTCSTRSR